MDTTTEAHGAIEISTLLPFGKTVIDQMIAAGYRTLDDFEGVSMIELARGTYAYE